MYLTPSKNHWIIDTETDGLRDEATRMWVTCVENAVTDEKHTFTDKEELRKWVGNHPDAIFIGHNIIAFDCPVLNRLTGTRISILRCVDTLILSMLYSPNYAGGHSLDVWGQRLKFKKIEFNDFSHLSDEMIKYCQQDVALTKKLFVMLTKRMRETGFTEKGAELEHLSWHIIQNKQKRYGFPFNKKEAEILYAKLRQREEELKDEIYKLWPPKLCVVGEYKKACKADGHPTAGFERHREQFPRLELDGEGGYRAYDWVEFNLGSPKQRIEKLLEIGWTPSKYTKKGNPQVDEDSLLAFAEESGKTELNALAKWIVTNSRANMINTWLNAYREDTGAIHGNLWLAGTLRYRHDNPNSANIPAVRLNKQEEILYGEEGAWTYEARNLWTCGDADKYVLVGIDGTGIQNRCLIHNLIITVGEEAVASFRDLALEGDIHKHNIEVLGLFNKAAAKKFYYTLMMGGGGARLAADQIQFGTHMTAKQGEAKKKMLIESIPGFGNLIGKLKGQLKRQGRIILCDGTPILVPSEHMVIPYLLQGDESRLMKQASIFLDQEIRKNKIEAYKVADIHDEWQFKVRKEHVEEFKRLALSVFPRSGEAFGYRIPIEGDTKVGRTWAETH